MLEYRHHIAIGGGCNMTKYEFYSRQIERANGLYDEVKDPLMAVFYENVIIGLYFRQMEMSVEDAENEF